MMKKLFLILLLIITQKNFSQSQWVETGNIIEGEIEDGLFGEEIVMSKDGKVLAVADPFRFGNSSIPNPVTIFERQGDEWIETAKLFDEEVVSNFFGFSMSFNNDGSILAIGIRNGSSTNSTPQGRVQVYKNVQGTWGQVGSDISNTISGGEFGRAISMNADGSILAVGNPDSGITQVYVNNSDNWEQLGENIGAGNVDDFFGQSLSLSNDGTVLAIGALEAFSGNGRVEVYKFENDNWTPSGNTIFGKNPEGQFGSNTKLSGDGKTLVAASISPNFNSVSYVEIYKNRGGQWEQIGDALSACEYCLSSELGQDIGISDNGKIIAIADPSADNDNGSQTIDFLSLQEDSWTLLQQIAIINPPIDNPERFGTSIAFSTDGNIIAAGSPEYKKNGDIVGAVRTYENSSILSTNENIFDTNLLLHPNPFFNSITVDFKEIQKSLNVTILDIQGRKIESIDFYNKSIIDINLEVSAGTYFIKVINSRGNTKTFKAIKQ